MKDIIIKEEAQKEGWSERSQAMFREIGAMLRATTTYEKGATAPAVRYTPRIPELPAAEVLQEWKVVAKTLRNAYALDLQQGRRGKADVAQRILALTEITQMVERYEKEGV